VQQGALLWKIKDSSTNGTWINKERIHKGMSFVISPGDHITLSCGDSVLEYAFETEDHADPANKRKVGAYPKPMHEYCIQLSVSILALSLHPSKAEVASADPGTKRAAARSDSASPSSVTPSCVGPHRPPPLSTDLSSYEKQIQVGKSYRNQPPVMT